MLLWEWGHRGRQTTSETSSLRRPQQAWKGPGPLTASAHQGPGHTPASLSFSCLHGINTDMLQDLCWALVTEWVPVLELPGELSESEPRLRVSQCVPIWAGTEARSPRPTFLGE